MLEVLPIAALQGGDQAGETPSWSFFFWWFLTCVPPLDADEIVPGLWQGSWPSFGSVVSNAGFHTLVLTARELQYPAELYHGVKVIHAPNDDNEERYPFTREKLAVALQAAREVVTDIQSGKKVLVTCAAGKNRSGLVSALTLHLLYGWPGSDCAALVRRKRIPLDGLPALSNPVFSQALSQLQGNTSASKSPSSFVLSGGSQGSLWLPGSSRGVGSGSGFGSR